MLTQLSEAQGGGSTSGNERMIPATSLSKFDTPSSSCGALATAGSGDNLRSKSSSPAKADSKMVRELQETKQRLEASEKKLESAEKNLETSQREKTALETEIVDLNVRLMEVGKENLDLEEERDNSKEALRVARLLDGASSVGVSEAVSAQVVRDSSDTSKIQAVEETIQQENIVFS